MIYQEKSELSKIIVLALFLTSPVAMATAHTLAKMRE